MVVYDGDASILVAKYRLVYLWFFFMEQVRSQGRLSLAADDTDNW